MPSLLDPNFIRTQRLACQLAMLQAMPSQHRDPPDRH